MVRAILQPTRHRPRALSLPFAEAFAEAFAEDDVGLLYADRCRIAPSATMRVSVTIVESRKAWRNRERFAGEEVLALLEALRTGAGAESAGLFDDDRADAVPGLGVGALNFWDAFDVPPCATIDWDEWYGELKTNDRVQTICGCDQAHRLCGFLIHGRWGLLLVMPSSLPSDGAAAIASSLQALAAKLPPARTDRERLETSRYDADAASAAGVSGGPVWWVRRRPQ